MLGGRWSQNPYIPLNEKMNDIMKGLKNEGNSIYNSNTILITLHNSY